MYLYFHKCLIFTLLNDEVQEELRIGKITVNRNDWGRLDGVTEPRVEFALACGQVEDKGVRNRMGSAQVKTKQ